MKGFLTAREDYLRFAVTASLFADEPLRQGDGGSRLLFDHDERVVPQPAAGEQGVERRRREALAIGRVQKGQTESFAGRRSAELRRVAAKDPRDAAESQRFDVFPQQGARFGAVIDEKRALRAARDRLQPEAAGAREKVDDVGALDDVVIGVGEDVENRFPAAARRSGAPPAISGL